MIHPQVPAEQCTQRLWCGICHKVEFIGIDEVAEELGWHEGLCPDCAATVTEGVTDVTAEITAP